MSTRIFTILAALALGAAVLPTAAEAGHTKGVTYAGKTRAGDPISLVLTGTRISHLSAYVPTVCLPTHGTPRSGTDPFDPPGSFRLGRTQKVTAKRPNALGVTSDVTKHFLITTKRTRAGHITGKLHVDYSFLQILYTYPISAVPYVCTGDTTF
jgi:hypothetical protein